MQSDEAIPHNDHHIPLVIVEGFLGGAGPVLWGNFEKHSNHDIKVDDENPPRRVIFASVGPVSSLHDRACELYYALRGGPVDYGANHANQSGHARYGRNHAHGLYPEWSSDKPLHFLGHSLGGPTIIKLQWLISTGFFGDSDHADMILSVTTVSAPFRGSQAVYALGERADRAPAVRPLSVGSILAKVVHIASYFSPLLPTTGTLDLHTDSRSLSCDRTSFVTFLRHLWHSDWAEGRDATPFDVTFEASDQREARMEGQVNPSTFYRSYAACMTRRNSEEDGYHTPRMKNMAYVPPLYALSRTMGTFSFDTVRPTPGCVKPSALADDTEPEPEVEADTADARGVKQEALWANDGVVPLFSQWHPRECRMTSCRHYPGDFSDADKRDDVPPQPGVWHVYQLDDANHISLAPFWFGTARQQAFWRDMGRWLREVDRTFHALC